MNLFFYLVPKVRNSRILRIDLAQHLSKSIPLWLLLSALITNFMKENWVIIYVTNIPFYFQKWSKKIIILFFSTYTTPFQLVFLLRALISAQSASMKRLIVFQKNILQHPKPMQFIYFHFIILIKITGFYFLNISSISNRLNSIRSHARAAFIALSIHCTHFFCVPSFFVCLSVATTILCDRLPVDHFYGGIKTYQKCSTIDNSVSMLCDTSSREHCQLISSKYKGWHFGKNRTSCLNSTGGISAIEYLYIVTCVVWSALQFRKL